MRSGALDGRTVLVLVAAAVLVPSLAWAQRAEGSFQRTLNVSGQAEIDIVSGSGRIEVRQGSAGRIEISARILASDSWGWNRKFQLSPEERVRRIEANPPIEQNASVVRIGYLTSDELRDGVAISYVLTVPPHSSLKSKTGSGSQDLTGVDGSVEASTGSGSLTISRVGGDLHASTGSGSIEATSVGGAFHATTGSGSIGATEVRGAITAKTGSGRIDVTQAGSGNVEVASGSGSVRLRGVRGAVHASTSSGGMTIAGDLSGDWDLSATSGSVTVDLPASQGFELRCLQGELQGIAEAIEAAGSLNEAFPSVRASIALIHAELGRLFSAVAPGAPVAVDGTAVYWADHVDETIGRAPVSGGSTVNNFFIRALGDPTGVAVDGLLSASPGPQPPPAIGPLAADVQRLGLPHGIERSLLAKLDAAERAVDAGNRETGCDILNAYVHEAQAQSGHKLDAAPAAGLVGDATAIRQSLGCGAD